MERPENGPKIAKNQENIETPEKALKGFEGHVFEDIVFTASTNKKGRVTYKSSNPERKIIILDDASDKPEGGQSCRVLIVEDTDPSDPMVGKMIARMVGEDLSSVEAEKLALSLKKGHETGKHEDILTSEDRERLADLIAKCSEYNVAYYPDYPEENDNNDFYDDDYYDANGEPIDLQEKKARKEKELVEARTRANTAIDLRRRLRDEGSKAVSYIVELARLTKNPLLLYQYSGMLYFAATEKDASKVLNFYNLDPIAKNNLDRSTKTGIGTLMKRIGTAKDVDALKKFLDKVLQTKYEHDTVGLEVMDAKMVLGILLEIEEKTTDLKDLDKIGRAIKYTKNRIDKSGGGFGHDDIFPVGPKQLNADFEEEFIYVELRNAIKEFTDFCDDSSSYDTRWDEEGLEEVIVKLQKVLEKYHAEDKLPGLINAAYWSLLGHACDYPDDEGYLAAMKVIRGLTGIAPDYKILDPEIQTEYKDCLLGDASAESPAFARQLYKNTGVKFKIDAGTIQKKILEIIASEQIAIDYLEEYLPAIREIADANLDFSSIEGKLQEIYRTIFINALGYEPAFNYGGAWLKKAEMIYNVTGIRPKIDESEMKRQYRAWIFYKDALELITAAEFMTGVQPDFSGLEYSVQAEYHKLIASILDKDTYLAAKDKIGNFERITKVAPVFDENKVQEIYLSYVLQHPSGSALNMVQELTGIAPNFEPYKDRITSVYFERLTTFAPDFINETLDGIKKLRETTGIRLDFSPEDAGIVYRYAGRRLRTVGRLSDIFRLEEVIPNPELMAGVAGEILVNSIADSNTAAFRLAKEKMKELKIPVNVEDIDKLVHRCLVDDPAKVVGILKFLTGESSDDEFSFFLQKVISHNPWVAAFSRLAKIQGIAVNAANNPWENELKPLVRRAFSRGLIHVEQRGDAELLVSFIEEMGMNNLPQLFEVYVDCQRHKDPATISTNTLVLCEQFGIKARNKDGSSRFKSSLELFNELSKALRNIRTDLLADKIPNNIETGLGIELFNGLKGHTQYERNHNVGSIIRRWKETTRENHSLAELPPGFREATIKVPHVKRQKVEATQDQAERLDKFMASQEVADVYLPLAQTWETILRKPIQVWFTEVAGRFYGENTSILELLSKSQEEIGGMIAEEADPELKQALIKKSKALQNPKGRQGIERQAELLKEVADKIVEISGNLGDTYTEDGLVASLEALNKLDGRVALGKEIRELSAFHMYGVMGDWWQFVAELFALPGHTGVNPTAGRIYGVQKIAKDYVEEHYLHYQQDQGHTEHTPFSQELLEKLNLVWQQKLDKNTGYLPITFLKNKLDLILGVESGQLQKETNVAMVPVSGLLHIYSGDLGDSCHTSQHDAIASGQFPNLRTWVYVTNRGRQNEELRGSVLSILSETRASGINGTPVLIVRANNPSENFIQTTDADAFTVEVLKEAVETAKRLRADRIKKNPSLPTAKMRQIVAIPMDDRGQASTNRQPINDIYRSRFFQNAEKIGLTDTPDTNFNNYNLWKKNKVMGEDYVYGSPVYTIKIWEIDEDGNEKWYGDWK